MMRWTLFTKFTLVVGALVASAILGSVMSLLAERHSTELLAQAINQSLPSVRAAEELEIAILEQQRLTRRYVLDEEPRPSPDPLEAKKTDFTQWFEEARRVPATEEALEILGRIETAYAGYAHHRDRALELSGKGQSAEAKRHFLNQATPAFDQVYGLCEEFIGNNERYVRTVEEHVRAGIRKVTSLAILGMALTVGLGVALLVLFFVGVMLPLRRMRADAERFSASLRFAGERSGNADLALIAEYLRSLMMDVEDTRTQLAQSRLRLDAAEKLASVGKLAASVAHEIRNPLTAIKMWLFAIERSVAGDAELERRLQLVSAEIARLERIIRSFLEFSRPAPPRLARHDVGRLIEKTMEFFGPRLEARQLRLVQSVPPGLPPVLADDVAALRPELAFLYRLALACKARREVVRGKPETFTRPDYTFKLEGVQGKEPHGDETVIIGTRSRGAPLDLMVAEAMILANSTWGQLLADSGVPGIYRSQASLAPGVKVRMGAKALPHAGIGVPCYAWSTSPLRRYTDLVNQWQIIACARHGKTAALVAPFKPKDAGLFSVISAFDAAYTAYNQFQNGMERYWTLHYLQQHALSEITATVIKDNLVRADTLPLVLPVLGAEGLPRGAQVRVRLGAIDDISLEVNGTVIERLDQTAPADALDEEGDDEAELAAPLTIAMDVNEDDPAGKTTDAGDAGANSGAAG
jgi:signal transduction histidine kinase